MLKKIGGTIVAIFAGGLVVFLLEQLSHLVYPIPENLNFQDKNQLKEYVETLPLGAFIGLIISHFLGAAVASFIAKSITKIKVLVVVAGLFILLGTIANLVIIPYHPVWFAIVDIVATIAGLFLVLMLFKKKIEPKTNQKITKQNTAKQNTEKKVVKKKIVKRKIHPADRGRRR